MRFPIQLREKLVNEISVAGDVKLFRPIQVGLGAQAQLVTRLAAQKLLAKTQDDLTDLLILICRSFGNME